MAHYRKVGDVPAKRHTRFGDGNGGLYYEELMGEEGFSSDSSLLYHRHIPSAVGGATPWALPEQALVPNAPLLPRHYRLHELFPGEAGKAHDVVTGRVLVLGNGDVRISYVVVGEASPLYRNAIGDELVYVEEGCGVVETAFGVLPFSTGDYVVVPRATVHRWVPDGVVRCAAVLAEPDARVLASELVAAGPVGLRRARRAFVSFGTCDVDDPRRDLEALGLLAPEHAPDDATEEVNA